jgi:hypothetical protein
MLNALLNSYVVYIVEAGICTSNMFDFFNNQFLMSRVLDDFRQEVSRAILKQMIIVYRGESD